MTVKQLTAAEAAWLKQFQALMEKCPSKRLGAYTVGDADLTIYDKSVHDKHLKANPREERDDTAVHAELGTVLISIKMPFQVDGVCG